jgi:hypothetical protein
MGMLGLSVGCGRGSGGYGYENYPKGVTTVEELELLPKDTTSVRLIRAEDPLIAEVVSFPELTYVLISQYHRTHDEPLSLQGADILARLPKLRQVVLAKAPGVSDEFLLALAASSSLEELYVHDCRNVTRVGFNHAVRRAKALKGYGLTGG